MRRMICLFCLLISAFCFCWGLAPSVAEGQTTHNLDIIWQKAKPETSMYWQAWGYSIIGGDLNGDGYSDFISAIDSSLGTGSDRRKCKIYVFNGGISISTIPSQIIVYDSLQARPTFYISDFNNDGYGDLAIADQGGLGVNNKKGQVNIHYGSSSGISAAPDLIIGGYGPHLYTGFGASLSAGDINGDGVSDLIVGAPYWGPDYALGRVYVYYGDTLGLHTSPDVILNGRVEAGYYEFFGYRVSSGADMNEDGYDDILIGAYGNSGNGVGCGKVYVYRGGAPMDTLPDAWIYGEGSQQMIGLRNVSIVKSEVAATKSTGWFGTCDWPTTSGSFGYGKCYMIPGDVIGLAAPLWTISGDVLSDSGLGLWSSSAGFADDDRTEDMLASALKGLYDPGAVYLWLRREAMQQQPDAYITGRPNMPGGDALGARTAPAGDVDGDGRGEFLISNYYADSSQMIWLCKYTGPNAGMEQDLIDKNRITECILLRNTPNPFSTTTQIGYNLTKANKVKVDIYNISGQHVICLVNENKPSGRYAVKWDGKNQRGVKCSPGIYIYKLETGDMSKMNKMLLVR